MNHCDDPLERLISSQRKLEWENRGLTSKERLKTLRLESNLRKRSEAFFKNRKEAKLNKMQFDKKRIEQWSK